MSTEISIPQRIQLPAQIDRETSASGLRRTIRLGMIVVGILTFGLGGMAATIPITGAVIAQGQISVKSRVKQVGHPTGGVLAELLVEEGAKVKAGQLLMRLDSTVSSANASATAENVDQLLAMEARLLAERDNLGAIQFPAELTSRASDPRVANIMQTERRNFVLRRKSRQGQQSQLAQRINQTRSEIGSLEARAISYDRQADLLNEELATARELFEQRYTTLDRVNALERSAVSVAADADGARASARQAASRVAELQEQRNSLSQEMRSAAASQLVDVQAQLVDLKRSNVAAVDSFDRSSIKAPFAGIIEKLEFATIGGVIPAGKTILQIVPDNDQQVVRAQVNPTDIDQVSVGRKATLRFSAFSMRTTPEIEGEVSYVATDSTVDPQTGAAYYATTISLPPSETKKLGSIKLTPGMPVETFIQTGDRTLMNFILKPLSDQLKRAFRQN